MPPCPFRCVNVTHASGALQFLASSTADFDVPGSRLGRAALMSPGTSTSSVDSSPTTGGFSQTMLKTTTMPAIPMIASPPRIPNQNPQKPNNKPHNKTKQKNKTNPPRASG